MFGVSGKPDRPLLNLALQGGGAHGAFTWGVLDGLLADGRIDFDGLSGTSAGAMNAVCLAHGWLQGGRDGARQALADFWSAVADSAPFSPTPGEAHALAPALKVMLHWAEHLSPDQLNPFDLNPLRDIVAAQIDFAGLRQASRLKLFIAATHANSGKLRIFRNAELSVDTVLASACLPTIHRTIMIDGEPYWDGGYSANPAVFPLFWECAAEDVLLVLLSPLKFGPTPDSAQDIRHRLQELAFNSTFLREMRMYAHLRDQLAASWLPMGRLERRLVRTKFHAISAESLLGQLPGETRLSANRQFFMQLCDSGRAHAAAWLEQHFSALGQRSTLDIGKLFY